ncbi:MAG: nucleotide exchange factor GrpE [Anaerolineae bacterium]|nr:nucleotide exchange factor GrpE [Anaerolineae bacterium]
MYWNSYDRPGYHKIPVRRAPVGGASPYSSRPVEPVEARPTPSAEPTEPAVVEEKSVPAPSTADETDWHAVALQQQAEMDNFRKRQTRRADEAIVAERERLLRAVLPVADNLSRALSYNDTAENNLRQGVELTQRELLRFLAAEGVTKIETIGQPFTPELHEALSVVPAQAEPNTIVQEVEAGYMLGDKLLRPAKVIVAA